MFDWVQFVGQEYFCGESQISDLTNDFLENTGFKLAVDLSFQIQTSPVNI